MKKSDKLDIMCITKIIKHLRTLDEAFEQFNIQSADDLSESDICQLAVTQIITNIYELKNKMQESSLEKTAILKKINLKAARNIASHDYDSLDFDIVYKRCMQLRNPNILEELESVCNDLRENSEEHKDCK